MKFSDSHTDIMTALQEKEEREKVVCNIKKLGGDNISLAIFTTEKKQTISEIEKLNDEIESLRKKYDLSLFMSIEDMGFLDKKADIKKLISLKPISATLTWNYQNQFAGGSLTDFGLTKRGIKLVDFFEDNGVIVDSAHLNRRSFFQLCQMSHKPIYNSHSNIDNIFSHNRNLTDEQIEKIVISEGFLGLSFYQKFISNQRIGALDIAKQFDYLIQHFGSDNFGIGSDLYGFDKRFLPHEIEKGTFINELKKHMQDFGYGEKIINKILWGNYENFLKKQHFI